MKDTIEINGVVVSALALADVLNSITNPDPSRWYNFERQESEFGASIVVSVVVKKPE